MTSHAPETLFSHPEAHQPQVAAGPARLDQPTWTNLFQEPPATAGPSSEN
ncbi:hypothetical protein [Lentzea sp. NEAU-D7]|nr:hypothetical protein [Lentzea sp. NEAU-D7]MCX2951525.1 hypothetical protein [Lentzea sp. NEAU-D7]